MSKKATSMGFTALMILSVLVVMNIVPVENVSAAGDPVWNPNGYYETSGDWIVDLGSTKTWTDETIRVNGDLIITPPNILQLINTTLIMNCTSDGQYNITVQTGAGMDIKDHDSDPQTTLDASVITSFSPTYEFGFVVLPGASFDMRYSELDECGWDYNISLTEQWSGLQVMNTGAQIINNTISNCYMGVVLYNAQNVVIEGNIFTDNYDSAIYGTAQNTGIIIDDNVISNSKRGIRLNQTGQISLITNNDITNMEFVGIEAKICDNLTVDNNTIFDVYSLTIDSYGIYIEEIFDSTITNNKVNEADDTGIWVAALCNDIFIYNNQVTNCTDTWSYGIRVDGANEINLTENYLDNNSIGLNIGATTNISVYNNTITNHDGFGMTIMSNSGNVVIVNNTIQYNDINLQIIDQDGFYVSGNDVGYGGDTGWYSNEGGINIWDCTNGLFYNNYVHDNYISFPVDRFPIKGYWVYGSSDITIENETIENNQVNLNVYGDDFSTRSSNVELINCTLIDGFNTDYDINISADPMKPSYCTLVNTTWDNTSIDWNSQDSKLKVKWFLNVKTTSGGAPVPNVNIWTNDTFGTNEGQGTTGASGWVEWLKCTEYVERDTDDNGIGERTYHTPHNITAKEITGEREGFAQVNMWKSRWINIPLNYRPEVLDLNAIGEVYRTYTIFISANGTDFEDTENMLTSHFEYRDPSDLFWDTAYLGSPIYIPTYWRISFTPPYDAPTGWYDVRVRFEDSYMSFSNWSYSYDSINVLNNQPWVEGMTNETETTPNIVYRGEDAWIFADGQDIENQDDYNFSKTNATEFQYQRPGESTWTHIDYWTTIAGKDPFNQDWKRRFTPTSSVDTPLGWYSFRVRFQDDDGEWSNWYTLYDWLLVENNPPNALNLEANYSEVYRGDSIWLYANATDIEEDEDQFNVQFSWDAPGGGSTDWETGYLSQKSYVGTSPSGYWKINFQPTESESRLGLYKFRVRFTDSNGSYEEIIENALVEVKNNLPTILTVDSSSLNIRAGGTPIYIAVNADDLEDNENELKVYAIADDIQYQFYGKNGTSPTGLWVSDYFGVSTWETTGSYIKVPFQPDGDAPEGYYDIRVRVTDNDTGKSDYIYLAGGIKNDMIQVYPSKSVVDAVEPLEDEVYRTDTVYIKVEASDSLDSWNELTVYVQHKAPGKDWMETYIGTPQESGDGDWWEVPFTPDEDANLGNYDFQARVKNTDDIYSDWISPSGDITIVQVKNNLPDTSNLRVVGDNNVERGSSIFIYVDGADIEDAEEYLSLDIEYSSDGSTWDDLYIQDIRPPNATSTSWRVTFSPPPLDTFDLGNYDFRATFSDTDGDGEDTDTVIFLVEVTNAIPKVEDLQVPESAYRSKSIFLGANASDVETDENELVPNFKYKGPSGDWVGYGDSGSYFQDKAKYINGYWQIEFKASADAEEGTYSFQVQFSDNVDVSQWSVLENQLDLMSSSPIVIHLDTPTSGYRLMSYYITANGSDLETSEELLIPTFQYRSSTGDWVSHEDSDSYFTGVPQYIDEYWKIEFQAPADAVLGLYSFQVRFSDSLNSSDWYPLDNVFNLKNNLPEVTITTPLAGLQSTSDITFTADASDAEDSSLDFSWDFGDGESSQETSPTHEYNSSGIYIIILIVTDDDGATATTTLSISITIPETEPDDKEEESNWLNLMLILIMVVVVIMLLLLFLMKRRKPEPEALPSPEAPEEIPETEPEEAPKPEITEDEALRTDSSNENIPSTSISEEEDIPPSSSD